MLEKGSSSSISRGTPAPGQSPPAAAGHRRVDGDSDPQPLQIDQRQRLVHLLLTGTAIEFGQTEADVVGHRQVGKKGVILKDHADVARLGRHAGTGPVEQGIAEADRALRQRQQASDGLEQRGLAAAARSQQADDLVVSHRQESCSSTLR